MKKQSWYDKCYEAFRLTFFVAGLVVIATWGVLLGYVTYENHFAKYFEKAAEKSPGELVDLAMQIPGSIVISPHRDLVSLGIETIEIKPEYGDLKIYLKSPAIGVHTKQYWCIWELGNTAAALDVKGDWIGHVGVSGHGTHLINSHNQAFQASYDSFTKCVEEGNAPVWHKVGKIVPCEELNSCDGKPDDTAAIKKAARAGAPGLSLTATGRLFYASDVKPCAQDGSLAPGETCSLSLCTCSGGSDCDRCNHHEEDHSEGIE